MSVTIEQVGEVTYRIYADRDELCGYHGWVTDDDGQPDLEWEGEVERRLNEGDSWAWANVEVEARITVDDIHYTGHSYLGGCNYQDAEDFMDEGPYDDLKKTAFADLIRNLKQDVATGQAAQKTLALLEGRQARTVDFNGEGAK